MTTLDRITPAARVRQLLSSTTGNLVALRSVFLAANLPSWAEQSNADLVANGAWGQLDERFYHFIKVAAKARAEGWLVSSV